LVSTAILSDDTSVVKLTHICISSVSDLASDTDSIQAEAKCDTQNQQQFPSSNTKSENPVEMNVCFLMDKKVILGLSACMDRGCCKCQETAPSYCWCSAPRLCGYPSPLSPFPSQVCPLGVKERL